MPKEPTQKTCSLQCVELVQLESSIWFNKSIPVFQLLNRTKFKSTHCINLICSVSMSCNFQSKLLTAILSVTWSQWRLAWLIKVHYTSFEDLISLPFNSLVLDHCKAGEYGHFPAVNKKKALSLSWAGETKYMKEWPTPKDFSLKSFIGYCNVLGIMYVTKLASIHPFLKNSVSL